MGWATEYFAMQSGMQKTAILGSLWAQTSNAFNHAAGQTVPIGKHRLMWGAVPLALGAGLIGAAGHAAGHSAVRKTLTDAGSSPEDIARADYMAKTPASGYGFGSALASGAAGVGAGLATNLALQRAAGLSPVLGHAGGLVAGLGTGYLTAKYLSEKAERDRLKGLER
jgi:hypothetical protein